MYLCMCTSTYEDSGSALMVCPRWGDSLPIRDTPWGPHPGGMCVPDGGGPESCSPMSWWGPYCGVPRVSRD